MAKVLRWSHKRLIAPRTPKADRSVIELQTAKEILCEIFDIRPCEADDMIQQRLEEGALYDLEFHLVD